MLMEYQSTHFDTLSILFVLSTWDVESSMRHTSRTSVLLRVETLDENHLLGAKVRLIVPPSVEC